MGQGPRTKAIHEGVFDNNKIAIKEDKFFKRFDGIANETKFFAMIASMCIRVGTGKVAVGGYELSTLAYITERVSEVFGVDDEAVTGLGD